MQDEEKIYGVYKHTNVVNGKVYIGVTRRKPQSRWGHNGCNYRENPHFYSAIQKYGWDTGFVHEILFANLSKDEADSKEIELIALHKSNDQRFGYNVENGGNSTGKMADSTKQKIGAARVGKLHTDESKQKMSESAMRTSKERSEAFSARRKEMNFRPWNEGVVFSEERKDEIKGNTYRVVRCIELDEVYKSLSYASRRLGIAVSGICCACKGIQETAGGYHFEYVTIA